MNWEKRQRKIATRLLARMLASNHCPIDPVATAIREANKLMVALRIDNDKTKEAA